MKLPWQKTEIERNLTNEPNQSQIDGDFAAMLNAQLADRNATKAQAADILRLAQEMEKLERWLKSNS